MKELSKQIKATILLLTIAVSFNVHEFFHDHQNHQEQTCELHSKEICQNTKHFKQVVSSDDCQVLLLSDVVVPTFEFVEFVAQKSVHHYLFSMVPYSQASILFSSRGPPTANLS